MKALFLLIFSVCFLSGCVSNTITNRMGILPSGSADTIKAVVTGKFSATQLEAENWHKDDQYETAKRLHVRHTNYWIPLIEYETTNYRQVKKANK